MPKLILVLTVLSVVLIIVQSRIIKRDDHWACEWDCPSYRTYTHRGGLDPMQGFYHILGIGRKKRGVYPPYGYNCDCSTLG